MDTVLSTRRDVYRAVTEQIIEAMRMDTGAFRMPWHSPGQPIGLPANVATHASYRGVNVLSLWVSAVKNRYPYGLWASYKQWQSVDAQVRKGERGSLIIFYKQLDEAQPQENKEDPPRFVARASHVFNAAQVDGFAPEESSELSEDVRNQTVEAFVVATGARIRNGYQVACYRSDLDDIEMPNRSWFQGTGTMPPLSAYYAVLLHELTHWTGASHRLDREFGAHFGDQAYAFEELVAELGAAFLCAELGISNEPRPDHARYLKSWLAILADGPRALITAASKAQEAAEYLAALASK